MIELCFSGFKMLREGGGGGTYVTLNFVPENSYLHQNGVIFHQKLIGAILLNRHTTFNNAKLNNIYLMVIHNYQISSTPFFEFLFKV